MSPNFFYVYKVTYVRPGHAGYVPASGWTVHVLAESVEEAIEAAEQYLACLGTNDEGPGNLIYEILSVQRLFEVFCGLDAAQIGELESTVEDDLRPSTRETLRG